MKNNFEDLKDLLFNCDDNQFEKLFGIPKKHLPVSNTLKVNIKKLRPDAVIPTYAKPGDAGLDLTTISMTTQVKANVNQWVYGTGLAIEIPEGYVGLLFPRSSIHKTGFLLSNSVGVIDSGYRGEIKFIFSELNYGDDAYHGQQYLEGDRIGQLIILPYPKIQFEEVEELSETERGSGGFGSSGK